MIDIIRDFLFADDCSLNAAMECDMQRSVNEFVATCSNLWAHHQYNENIDLVPTSAWKAYTWTSITIDDMKPNAMTKYTYLDNVPSQNATIDDEVHA